MQTLLSRQSSPQVSLFQLREALSPSVAYSSFQTKGLSSYVAQTRSYRSGVSALYAKRFTIATFIKTYGRSNRSSLTSLALITPLELTIERPSSKSNSPLDLNPRRATCAALTRQFRRCSLANAYSKVGEPRQLKASKRGYSPPSSSSTLPLLRGIVEGIYTSVFRANEALGGRQQGASSPLVRFRSSLPTITAIGWLQLPRGRPFPNSRASPLGLVG